MVAPDVFSSMLYWMASSVLEVKTDYSECGVPGLAFAHVIQTLKASGHNPRIIFHRVGVLTAAANRHAWNTLKVLLDQHDCSTKDATEYRCPHAYCSKDAAHRIGH